VFGRVRLAVGSRPKVVIARRVDQLRVDLQVASGLLDRPLDDPDHAQLRGDLRDRFVGIAVAPNRRAGDDLEVGDRCQPGQKILVDAGGQRLDRVVADGLKRQYRDGIPTDRTSSRPTGSTRSLAPARRIPVPRTLIESGHRGDQPVATLRDGLDEARFGRAIAETAAEFGDAARQRIVGDDGRAPDLLAEVFPGHDLTRVPGQADQHLHRSRRQPNVASIADQAVLVRADLPLQQLETRFQRHESAVGLVLLQYSRVGPVARSASQSSIHGACSRRLGAAVRAFAPGVPAHWQCKPVVSDDDVFGGNGRKQQ